jgi:hypothetical protein
MKAAEDLERTVRSEGLVGVFLLLLTLVMFVYRAGPSNVNVHTGIADSALMGLHNAKADLQTLFDEKYSEHDLTLLRRRTMFGWDFVPAWMFYIFFLHRVIVMCRPSARRIAGVVILILTFTWMVNAWLNDYLAQADRQKVLTDVELNRIVFMGQVKWMFLFLDVFLCALYLLDRPLILRVGAVILAACSVVALFSIGFGSGLVIPYCVLGLFFAFSGICILLLFHPQLLYDVKT